ncbi:MAG: redoxin domain-containing protein [Rhodospirillaceae bacterium]
MRTPITRPFVVFTAALAMAGTVAASAFAEPAVEQPAPDFIGTDSKGNTVKLFELRGKTVILEWTNHDCPFVRKHYNSGNMQMTQNKAAADGIVWLSVISSAPGEQGHVSGAEADDLTKRRKANPSAVLLDPKGDIGRKYAAVTTPHMFIIDPKGMLKYKGAIDSIKSTDVADVPLAKNYVLNAIAQLKAGQTVDPRGTRPYGCSVKYGS